MSHRDRRVFWLLPPGLIHRLIVNRCSGVGGRLAMSIECTRAAVDVLAGLVDEIEHGAGFEGMLSALVQGFDRKATR